MVNRRAFACLAAVGPASRRAATKHAAREAGMPARACAKTRERAFGPDAPRYTCILPAGRNVPDEREGLPRDFPQRAAKPPALPQSAAASHIFSSVRARAFTRVATARAGRRSKDVACVVGTHASTDLVLVACRGSGRCVLGRDAHCHLGLPEALDMAGAHERHGSRAPRRVVQYHQLARSLFVAQRRAPSGTCHGHRQDTPRRTQDWQGNEPWGRACAGTPSCVPSSCPSFSLRGAGGGDAQQRCVSGWVAKAGLLRRGPVGGCGRHSAGVGG